jgi:purine nucleosidase
VTRRDEGIAMTRKIIIDTDPGQDDAVALLLALASPEELEVLGIVAVAGNVGLAQNARNALKIVELSGRTEVPVYAGCERPMRRKLVTAEHVHGPTGLDGPDLPEPQKKLEAKHGVDYIIDTLRSEEPGTVTLTLGPAPMSPALVKAPDIARASTNLMASAYFRSATYAAAEFNVYVDPGGRRGAHERRADHHDPLDVTHGVLAYRTAWKASPGSATRGRAVSELLFLGRFDLEVYGIGAPLHDPCVIAWLLKPELFKGRFINVSIETQSQLTRGMTVADYWRITDRPKNVLYLRTADDESFYRLLTERLARLP